MALNGPMVVRLDGQVRSGAVDAGVFGAARRLLAGASLGELAATVWDGPAGHLSHDWVGVGVAGPGPSYLTCGA
jgi:hypothetical protein